MTSSSQAARKHTEQGLPLRDLRNLEQRLKVFLVPAQDGLHVNPTNMQRFTVINGVEGEAEQPIGEVSSNGRWFSMEELEAKVRERLPKQRR